MAEVTNPGLSVADVLALIAANAATGYVAPPASPMTVANLLANFPASATYLNQYARVSDLYGAVDDIMRCRFDGTNYRWVPQRTDFAGNISGTGGAVNIVSLVSAPIMRVTESVASTLTLTLPSTNTYIGQSYFFQRSGLVNLLGVNISNLVGGGTVPLVTGGAMRATLFPTGWQIQ